MELKYVPFKMAGEKIVHWTEWHSGEKAKMNEEYEKSIDND